MVPAPCHLSGSLGKEHNHQKSTSKDYGFISEESATPGSIFFSCDLLL